MEGKAYILQLGMKYSQTQVSLAAYTQLGINRLDNLIATYAASSSCLLYQNTIVVCMKREVKEAEFQSFITTLKLMTYISSY